MTIPEEFKTSKAGSSDFLDKKISEIFGLKSFDKVLSGVF
jgi:hypothetical protein